MSTKKNYSKLKSVKHSKKTDNDNDDVKLLKDVEQVQDAFSKAEERSLDIKAFSKKMVVSEKKPSKTISEK